MTDAASDTTDSLVTGLSPAQTTLERNTAVNGNPPEDDEDESEPAPAEGGDDVPPRTEGSPQG